MKYIATIDDVIEKYYINRPLLDYQSQANTVHDTEKESPTICAGTHGYALWYVQEGVVGMLDIKGNDCIRRVYGVDGVAPCLQTMQGGMREPKIFQKWRGFNKGGNHEVCPTLTINSWECNNFVKYDRDPCKKLTEDYRIRKLTPRECLRLQDFPDTFKQVVSDSQMYKQAGNSMSVNILEMIFSQIEYAKKFTNSLF